MKSYTNIEQSKKLAKILPLESADMYYSCDEYPKPITKYAITYANVLYGSYDIRYFNIFEYTPCWSLAALLSVMPKEIVYKGNIVFLEFHAWENSLEYVNGSDYTLYVTESYDNSIDACYEMVLKLHELKML